MISRQPSTFPAAPSEVPNAEQVAQIETRRQYLRDMHAAVLEDEVFKIMLDPTGRRSIGGVLWQRELGFAKLALINQGRPLIDHWDVIKAERDMPPKIIAWECDETEFSRALDWQTTFYKVLTSDEQDETQRTLHGGTWIFQPVPALPGFSVVSDQQAIRFYNHIGGDMLHHEHITVRPESHGFHLQAGATETMTFVANGGEPPITWSLRNAPTWVSISPQGILTIAPPLSAVPDAHSFTVIAQGQHSAEGHADIIVWIRL